MGSLRPDYVLNQTPKKPMLQAAMGFFRDFHASDFTK
jgi:hypothetical protein